MDNTTMQKMARFKILARRLGGFNVDIFKLAQDDTYARELLMRAQDVDNETLILLALELSDALGLLAVAEKPKPLLKPTPPVAPVAVAAAASSSKHFFGARG